MKPHTYPSKLRSSNPSEMSLRWGGGGGGGGMERERERERERADAPGEEKESLEEDECEKKI